MSWRTAMAMTVFLGTTAVAFEASAACATGGVNPSATERGDFRTTLVEVRRAADLAARESRNLDYRRTGRELGKLGTIAIRVNASTYSPGFSCADMARGKQDIHEQLDDVYDEASDEGMSEEEQDNILGPVTDAAEDFYASGGVVFIVQP